MGRNFEPEAARAEIRGRMAANDAALVKVRERHEALALDVALGNAQQTELDALNAEEARLQRTAADLAGALAGVDKREAADLEAAAAAKHAADLAERERLLKVAHAASAKAADLVEKLAVVVGEAVEAERAAEVLGRAHGVNQRGVIGDDLARLMGARMFRHIPGLWHGSPNTGDEAAQRLKAV